MTRRLAGHLSSALDAGSSARPRARSSRKAGVRPGTDACRVASENLELVRSIVGPREQGDFSSADWAHPEIDYGGPVPRRASAEFLASFGELLRNRRSEVRILSGALVYWDSGRFERRSDTEGQMAQHLGSRGQSGRT